MDTCNCPPVPIGSNICHCGACHLTFNSVAAFDKHRTGDIPRRRCMTVVEMEAAGMTTNDAGRWITKAYEGPFARQEAAP